MAHFVEEDIVEVLSQLPVHVRGEFSKLSVLDQTARAHIENYEAIIKQLFSGETGSSDVLDGLLESFGQENDAARVATEEKIEISERMLTLLRQNLAYVEAESLQVRIRLEEDAEGCANAVERKFERALLRQQERRNRALTNCKPVRKVAKPEKKTTKDKIEQKTAEVPVEKIHDAIEEEVDKEDAISVSTASSDSSYEPIQCAATAQPLSPRPISKRALVVAPTKRHSCPLPQSKADPVERGGGLKRVLVPVRSSSTTPTKTPEKNPLVALIGSVSETETAEPEEESPPCTALVRILKPRRTPRKSQAAEQRAERREKLCSCRTFTGGPMIECGSGKCPFKWWHLKCVGLTSPPKGQWICRLCKAVSKVVQKRTKPERPTEPKPHLLQSVPLILNKSRADSDSCQRTIEFGPDKKKEASDEASPAKRSNPIEQARKQLKQSFQNQNGTVGVMNRPILAQKFKKDPTE